MAFEEIVDGDELIGRVRLIDRAGADADGGDACFGEVGGVGEPWRAGGFGSKLRESLDVGVGGWGFHGWVFMEFGDGEWEFEFFDGMLDEFEGPTSMGERGGDADIDFAGRMVGDDVWARTAVNHSDIHGGVAEDGVGEGGEVGDEVVLELVEGADEFDDCVIATFWA